MSGLLEEGNRNAEMRQKCCAAETKVPRVLDFTDVLIDSMFCMIITMLMSIEYKCITLISILNDEKRMCN